MSESAENVFAHDVKLYYAEQGIKCVATPLAAVSVISAS